MRKACNKTADGGLPVDPASCSSESKGARSKPFEPLLTVAEAALILKTSTKTIHRRIKAKKLPAIRDGDLVRIRRDDLEAYIAMHRTGGF